LLAPHVAPLIMLAATDRCTIRGAMRFASISAAMRVTEDDD
jgi:hypothetical protein